MFIRDTTTATQSFRFSRLDRLISPAEFQRVFRQANRSVDRFFVVLWRSNELPRARIGFAIAKKKVSLAVNRNRIRRLARESFRTQSHAFAGNDIIVLAQSAAKSANNKELLQSLNKHWAKIAVTKKRA